MFETPKRTLLPHNIRDLSPYVAGKTIAEVKETYKLSRISKLASNENRLGCSPSIKQAVLDVLDDVPDYPDPVSCKLRSALAERYGIETENIVIAAGLESIIANLCRTFFLNTDEAITADATFVGFFVQANIRGITLRKIPLQSNYRFDLDAIADSITGRTKMIYIANPNNPTGTYVTKTEFEAFMKKVPDDVIVVMDEAYFEYARQADDYPDTMDYRFDNVLTLRTFSKAYGLAGVRVGYCMGSRELIGPMMKTKLTFEPASLAQAAALAALQDEKFLNESIRIVEQGRKRLSRFFDEHGISYVPSIANFVMMILSTPQEAIDFTQAMLEQGVILRRVNAFGLPNCIRITIGTEQEMKHFEESFELHLLKE